MKSKLNSTATPPNYLEEIKAHLDRIQQLEKSLCEARNESRKLALELHNERTRQRDDAKSTAKANGENACPRCLDVTFNPKTTHKGQWIMHPDCLEFMKLDDHLKQNWRNEKEKRINEGLAQMKFILDTDEIKDSYGRWSCCGTEEYMAKGCPSKR